MNEERRLILKMVEEGKITADEAAALLEALGEEPEAAGDSHNTEDTWTRLEKQGEEFAHKVEAAAEKFSRSLEDKIEGGVGESLSRMGRMLSKLPFVSGEESYEMMREYSGQLRPGEWEVPISIHTANGRINVEGWEEEHYKIVVVQQVRAKDRDSARAKTVQLDLEDGAQDMESVHIMPPPAANVTFSFHVFVPKNRVYDVDILNTNGRIQLDGLHCRNVNVETTNGPITLEHVKGAEIYASTVNGSVQMAAVEGENVVQKAGNGSARLRVMARQLEATTTNGSIRVEPLMGTFAASEIKLAATNGSIRCMVARSSDLGTKVEAMTAVGRTDVELDGFEFTSQERRVGGSRMEGESRGFEEQPRKMTIWAKAGSGSIQISHLKEDGHGKA